VSGRIRTVKPEWLEDELLATASPAARVLSIALLLLADDYGNGRAARALLLGRVFPGHPIETLDSAMRELEDARYVELYERDSQSYFHIRNWSKHQKVDKPGRPLVPSPAGAAEPEPEQKESDFVYFVREDKSGNIKIGRSWNPDDRVRKFKTGSSSGLTMLGVIAGGWRERDIHKQFADTRIRANSEWFSSSDELLRFIREHSRPFATFRASRDPGPGPGTVPSPDPDRACPPLPELLAPEQRASMLVQMIPDWAIDAMLGDLHVSLAGGDKRMPLAQWRSYAGKALTNRWHDPNKRPKKPTASVTAAEQDEITRRRLEAEARHVADCRAKLGLSGAPPVASREAGLAAIASAVQKAQGAA
jgi:hypothetical protein